MLFTFKELGELAPGSIDGFTVKRLRWLTLTIQPMEDQTIYSLAEKIVNYFKKNPELMNIEFDYEGVNFNISNQILDSREIAQSCIDEVAKIRKDLASYYEIDENIINVILK